MSPVAPEITGNRATRRAAGQRGRKLAALGSGAVLATGVAAGAMASFATSAGAATTITVQNTNDSGGGSLRDALANANPGDTIDLTGVTGQISLTTGQLDIEDAVNITGPGASALTITANGNSRVFSMYTDLSGGTVTISGLTIANGDASASPGEGQGGGIFFDCTVEPEEGDDIPGTGSLVIDGSVITGNTSDELGGGLYFDRCGPDSTLTVTNSVFSGNTSTDDRAGGIWFDEGHSFTISNSTFTGNSAAESGGAVYVDNDDVFTVTNSTFNGNQAGVGEDKEGDGGAIDIDELAGSALIANSTFTGNSAAGSGGAISTFSGDLTLDQVTISGNTAVDGGDGLYLGYAQDGDVKSGQARNDHQDDGVSAQDVGAVALSGTIVSGNGDGTSDIASGGEGGAAATVASSVYGGVENVTVTDGGGNQPGVTNPGVGPLASNGGATQTMELLPGSPAIDKGPNPVADFPGNEFDQRGAGFDRVFNGTVDVGAFEVQAPAPAPEVVVTPKFTG